MRAHVARRARERERAVHDPPRGFAEPALDLCRRKACRQRAQDLQQRRVGQEAVAFKTGTLLDNPALAWQLRSEVMDQA
jgi:hypothetical protein